MSTPFEEERTEYWEALAAARAEARLERRADDAEYAGEARIYHLPDGFGEPE